MPIVKATQYNCMLTFRQMLIMYFENKSYTNKQCNRIAIIKTNILRYNVHIGKCMASIPQCTCSQSMNLSG